MRQFSPVEVAVNRNLLKYAAGTTMFCPECDRIMDAKTTVVATARNGTTVTRCCKCWDVLVAKFFPTTADTLDIVDGRDLWNTKAGRKALFGGQPKAPAPVAPPKTRKALLCVYCGTEYTDRANGPNGEDVACCGEVGHMEWVNETV
jgi:hypothetical protein